MKLKDDIDGPIGQARLTIVAMTLHAVRNVIDRSDSGIPNIAVLSGPAGFGKSTAMSVAATTLRAKYVEMPVVMRERTLLECLGREYGIHKFPATVDKLLSSVCALIGEAARPLFLDEFDRVLAKADPDKRAGPLEIIRYIADQTRVPILLCGEDNLGRSLKRFDNFHSRVLVWAPAPEASMEDVRKLAEFYSPNLTISDDLLERFRKSCGGNVRRITVNIQQLIQDALDANIAQVDLEFWGSRVINTGRAPQRVFDLHNRYD
jgi:AAA domain